MFFSDFKNVPKFVCNDMSKGHQQKFGPQSYGMSSLTSLSDQNNKG